VGCEVSNTTVVSEVGGVYLYACRLYTAVLWIDADPDQNVSDSDPDRHQHDADPYADPTLSFTHVESYFFYYCLVTALSAYNVLSFSSLYSVKDVIILSIFEQHIAISLKKVYSLYIFSYA
jgi:hypothetical protein